MINLALVLLLTLTSAAYAGAPQRVTYQGTLRKAGAIYTGTVPMEFKVTSADGSVTYWTSGSTGVYVSGGLFRYPLGTPNEAQFAVIPWGTVSPYVRVIVDGAALPADQLQSAPYALHAGTAEGSAGSFALADGDLRISTTAGSRGIIFQDGSAQYTAAASGLWTASGIDIYNSNAGGVGIGTASPSQKLEVAGTAKATAFQGDGSAVTNITASNIAGGSFADSAYTFPNNVTISGSLGADLNAGGFTITNLADPSSPQDGATKNYVDNLAGAGAVISATQTFTGQNSFTNQLAVSSNLFVTGGRIGVGTLSPAQELEVIGTVKATAFQGDGAAVANITASNITGGNFANAAYTFPNNLTVSGSLGANLNAGGFKITSLADPSAAQDGATKNYVDGLTGGGLPSAVLSATQTFTGLNGFSNQVTISSNLFVTNGNIGIGLNPVSARLDMTGAGRMINLQPGAGTRAADTSVLRIFDPQATTDAGIWSSVAVIQGADNVNQTAPVLSVYNYAASPQTGLYIAHQGAGPAVDIDKSGAGYGLIVRSGNVGIGTTAPSYKLDVSGEIRATTIIHADNNGAMYFEGGDDAALYDVNVANTLGIYGQQDSTQGHIKLGSSGPTISGVSGNVGIGTTAPAAGYKLDVSGRIKADNFGYVYTRWGNGTAPTGTSLLYNGYAYSAHYTHSGTGDLMCFKTGNPGVAAYSYGDLLYTVDLNHLQTDTPAVPSQSFVKCAVYYAPSPRFIVWGDDTCPAGWSLEYWGRGAGSYYTHTAPMERICVDTQNFDTSAGTAGGARAHMYASNMYSDEKQGQATNRNIKCAVCAKQ